MLSRPPSSLAWTAAVGGLCLFTACTPGAYPLDFFNEMPYQPSQRREQPARLAPPAHARPVTGPRAPGPLAQAALRHTPVGPAAANAVRATAVESAHWTGCHG